MGQRIPEDKRCDVHACKRGGACARKLEVIGGIRDTLIVVTAWLCGRHAKSWDTTWYDASDARKPGWAKR